jgi:hypothetical protein
MVALAVSFPLQIRAEEKSLSGHLEYHPSSKNFTLAAYNWGKLYYDADGKKKAPIKLTAEQVAMIAKLSADFQAAYGQRQPMDLPDDFSGAIMIFSFKPPGAEQTFTARVIEAENAPWKALSELRIYLDGIANPAKQTNAEAVPGQPATRSESKSEGSDKPQPESEGRSR